MVLDVKISIMVRLKNDEGKVILISEGDIYSFEPLEDGCQISFRDGKVVDVTVTVEQAMEIILVKKEGLINMIDEPIYCRPCK